MDLFGVEAPILLAPMAGPGTAALAVAVGEAGGLGALACAQLSVDQARVALAAVRAATKAPINVNFFCHQPPRVDPDRERAWRERLAPYYAELGLDPSAPKLPVNRSPFDEAFCGFLEDERPEVVSFHFGLPAPALMERAKKTGAKVISSATTVAEARWLEAHGCDAIIAQGLEAGGHRGWFLDHDLARQVGTFALVSGVVDAVSVPVIAAGGIGNARGIAAAITLGAAGAQIGTAYLLCPESGASPAYRQALESAGENDTLVTNLFTGGAARGLTNRLMRDLGAMSPLPPDFPLAAAALAPLRAAEAPDGTDFTNLWSGQGPRPIGGTPAAALTHKLAAEALARLEQRTTS